MSTPAAPMGHPGPTGQHREVPDAPLVRPVRDPPVVRQAAALFRRKGVTSTTMRDVGEAVGLSKAGLYHYYRSTDEFLHDIVQTGADALGAQPEDVLVLGDGLHAGQSRERRSSQRRAFGSGLSTA